MPRTAAFFLLFSLSLPILAACGSPLPPVTILPEDCHLGVGEELSLRLDGFIPPQATIRWDVDRGGIFFVLTNPKAVFVAPSQPTVVTVSASIVHPVFGTRVALTRQCIVSPSNTSDLAVLPGFPVLH